MTDVQVQSAIVDEIRAVIGGPGSLRWPSHVVLAALLAQIALVMRLTLRELADVMPMLEEGFSIATPSMRERLSERESVVRPLEVLELSQLASLHSALARSLSRPRAYKKPSHVVLGAYVLVAGQLAVLRGDTVEAAGQVVEAYAAHVTAEQVSEFQRRSIEQRAARSAMQS